MEDQEELLHYSDDESLSENEDQCLPVGDKPEVNPLRHPLYYFSHSRLEFMATKVILILSTAVVVITFPLYVETVNVRGNVYTLLLLSAAFSTAILWALVTVRNLGCPKFGRLRILNLPLEFKKLLQVSMLYALCGFAVVYAVDRKRVLCHLQDPIMGVVLVFSLIYYFFFCNKFMGLQRIFAATTIIVGLFVAVDYGLCDEFKCRGFEREHSFDDTGTWSWPVHAAWTSVYILGMALFAGYFTVMEKYLFSNDINTVVVASPSTEAPCLLSTVSRSVSQPGTSSNNPQRTRTAAAEEFHDSKKYSSIHFAFWLQCFVLIITVLLFFLDLIPQVGKVPGFKQFFNMTKNGILCHFQLPLWRHIDQSPCGNVSLYSSCFTISYTVFLVVYLKFLFLTQSAVYTVATMTASIPIVGIWWSLMHMVPVKHGLLVWDPTVSGELICSLLGLPIIFLGLFLLCKSHFKDYQWARLSAMHVMSVNNAA